MYLGQHVAAVPVYRVLPLVERGEVGTAQHRAGARALHLLASPPAPSAGAESRECPRGCWPPGAARPPKTAGRLAQACLHHHIDWSPSAPAQRATGLHPGTRVGEDKPPEGPARAHLGGPEGRGRPWASPGKGRAGAQGPTSWCSLWSSRSLECRWPHCTHRSTGAPGCSQCGRRHPAPSLQRQAGHVAGAGLCLPCGCVEGTGPLPTVALPWRVPQTQGSRDTSGHVRGAFLPEHLQCICVILGGQRGWDSGSPSGQKQPATQWSSQSWECSRLEQVSTQGDPHSRYCMLRGHVWAAGRRWGTCHALPLLPAREGMAWQGRGHTGHSRQSWGPRQSRGSPPAWVHWREYSARV